MSSKCRKVLSSFVAGMILVTQLQTLVFAAPQYSDAKEHWAAGVIERFSGYGILKGNDGNFRPNDSITRAEFSAILNRVMKYEAVSNTSFSDLKKDKWYYEDVTKLATAGVLKGYDGKVFPEDKITRQEAAVLVTRAFSMTEATTEGITFTDKSKIATWAETAVAELFKKGYIKGKGDNTFDPQGNLTRAEVVQILNNLVTEYVAAPGEVSKNVTGNLLVNTPGVTLKNMTISGNLYITEGVGEGDLTLTRNIQ